MTHHHLLSRTGIALATLLVLLGTLLPGLEARRRRRKRPWRPPVPAEVNGKWGFKNRRGRIAIKAIFDEARPFENGRAAVRVGSKWGFINGWGRFTAPARYLEVGAFSNDLALVRLPEGYRTINKSGVVQTAENLYLRKPSRVILPPGYQRGRRYPVLVPLPPTGGTAETFIARYLGSGKTLTAQFADMFKRFWPAAAVRKKREFILLVPPGTTSTADHSWRGFRAAIHRYDQRIMTDLRKLGPRYGMDLKRLVFAGYSLGGDLSWALSLRHPELPMGAIAFGSRCSYSRPGAVKRLASRGFRIFLAMGDQESDVRLRVLGYALKKLKRQRVRHIYHRIPNTAHFSPPTATFKRALEFTMFPPPARGSEAATPNPR